MKKWLYYIVLLVLIGCKKDPVAPTLYIQGACSFSVSDSSCVSFMPGILLYTKSYSDSYFHWELGGIMSNYGQGLSNYFNNHIDLFQYGTSGYSNAMPGADNAKSVLPNYDISGTKYDWGQYCDIEDCDRGSMRVLTAQEWQYVFELRPNASKLRAYRYSKDQSFLLLYPDNWIGSYNQKLYDELDYDNKSENFWNIVSDLQRLGIAIIPYIKVSGYYNTSSAISGYYWTSTYGAAFSLFNGVEYGLEPNCFMGVQLVKDVIK